MRPARLNFFLACAMLALALAGCTRTTGSVPQPAAVYANADLDRWAYARAVAADAREVTGTIPYRLDAGDRLRIVVYGQDGLSNSYTVDAGGMITMPLIGAVSARGSTPAELARVVASRLRSGYIREPHVAAEIETYRPFFILGEVAAPGQYPYVPNMTAENAVAIAGGFTARASRNGVDLTRPSAEGLRRGKVPLTTPLRPGDTVTVGERWF
jgi:polysaccharide export outer membrane protein